jgi:hypothetical protein
VHGGLDAWPFKIENWSIKLQGDLPVRVSLSTAHDSVILPICARYLLANRGDVAAAAMHAEAMGAPDRVQRILKTAVAAGNLTVPTSAGGAADLGIASAAFMVSLESVSAFFAILNNGAVRVPLRTKVNLSTTPAVGYLVGEGLASRLPH